MFNLLVITKSGRTKNVGEVPSGLFVRLLVRFCLAKGEMTGRTINKSACAEYKDNKNAIKNPGI